MAFKFRRVLHTNDDFCGFQDIPGKVSFTFDTWTSEAGDPYLSVTGHYIGSMAGNPNDWEMKSEQLGFTHIEGNYSGANLGGILIRVIDRYGIRNKASLSRAVIYVSLFMNSRIY
jgi:hypothetical protein